MNFGLITPIASLGKNPLSFDLYAGYDGNLMLAAEQGSGEILSSSQ
jgi:hypothetical protein